MNLKIILRDSATNKFITVKQFCFFVCLVASLLIAGRIGGDLCNVHYGFILALIQEVLL